jgi:hypothetical protein
MKHGDTESTEKNKKTPPLHALEGEGTRFSGCHATIANRRHSLALICFSA